MKNIRSAESVKCLLTVTDNGTHQ